MDPKLTAISRRSGLTGLALGTTAALTPSMSGGPESAIKGPAVWLDMDQKELDDAYSQ